ncbi:MAG: hypothetical protein EHM93_13145 [Bacteroidales bacterium]|nr:MAG: hypothetical protein EHM93_13145 [Bacteroidales bacterium]
MIEIFETWFNQFTRIEQKKLLKHIQENHSDLLEGYSSKPLNIRLLEGSVSSSGQNVLSTSNSCEKQRV